jgi:ribulose-phosphate 3-epimerase
MKSHILPSILAKSQNEIVHELRTVGKLGKHLHLDVADGKFAPNKSLWFPFRLSKKYTYHAHLMINNPIPWIKKHGHKMKFCLVHFSTLDDPAKFIGWMKRNKRKVGLALHPRVKVKQVKEYLGFVDYVLVLAVQPGFYGSTFIRSTMKKIGQVKKINPRVKVLVDGHMTPKTIGLARKADFIISGSYLMKSADPRKAMQELKKALKSA